MKITAKLFGTLQQGFQGYDHTKGIEVEIPDGGRVRDLLAHLEIPRSRGGVVAVKGRIMKFDDELKERDSVHVFQSVFGG